jgi:hypothetical protein
MKILIKFNTFLLVLFISGCSYLTDNDDATPYGNLKISGTVFMQNNPVAAAHIQIDDVNNWSVTSDGNGKFEIFRVAGGEREIRIEKSLEDGKIVGQRTRVFLSEQTADLGNFLLPLPSSMQPIDLSVVTSNSIQLSWNRSDDPDFVEYRIYRSTSPELSELTGELIFTTRSIDVLEFTDANFRTGIPVYYRVYVFSTFGRYAGSKIEIVTAPTLNLVQNPGFEESPGGAIPQSWLERLAGQPLFKFFSLTQEDKYSGDYGVKITYIESQANPHPVDGSWGGIYQHVYTQNMNSKETYSLSFWLKMVTGSMQVRVMKNGDFNQPLLYSELSATNQWQQHVIDFNIDEDTQFVEIWLNTKSGLAENGTVHGFIDDISIIK